ncbi:MAG: hypothetical protein ACLVJ6_05595 [Merdibacter sp.]
MLRTAQDEKGGKQRVQAKRPLKGAVGKEQPEQEGDERQDRKGLGTWCSTQESAARPEGRPLPAASGRCAAGSQRGRSKQKQPDQQSAQQQQLPLRVHETLKG